MISGLVLLAAKTAGEIAVSQCILGINAGIAVYVATKRTQRQGKGSKK